MDEAEVPLREQAYDKRCICVMFNQKYASAGDGHCQYDRMGPDAPFCINCDDRHPGMDGKNGYVVTTIFDLQREENGSERAG